MTTKTQTKQRCICEEVFKKLDHNTCSKCKNRNWINGYIIKACNSHYELIEALEAIKARIDGEFDNLSLLKFGTLSTNMQSDIYLIAKQALSKAEG